MIVQGPPKERSSQYCRGFSSNLWLGVAFDHWPTVQPCFSQRWPNDRTARSVFEQLHSQEEMKIVYIFLCFLIRLSVCTDAPESITNSPSSGFVEESASINYPGFGRRAERFFLLF